MAVYFARLRAMRSAPPDEPSEDLAVDPSDDLAAEFARLVLELGRGQASRIGLERFAAYDEGRT